MSKKPEGWRNIRPDDPKRHSLSAKGIPNAPVKPGAGRRILKTFPSSSLTPLDDEIDADILSVVQQIRKLGIDTFGSCAGHSNETYPSGHPKDKRAHISGRLQSLDELGRLDRFLVDTFAGGCPCGTCRRHYIDVRQDGDAGGFRETYSYYIGFKGRFENGQHVD